MSMLAFLKKQQDKGEQSLKSTASAAEKAPSKKKSATADSTNERDSK